MKLFIIDNRGKHSLAKDLSTGRYYVVVTKTMRVVGWGVNQSQALQVLKEM